MEWALRPGLGGPSLKLAYFVKPHIGGTYTLFRHLRTGLAGYGIDVRWMSCESTAEGAGIRHHDDEAGCMVTTPARLSEPERAAALIRELQRGRYDGVFVNVLTDRLQMNVARYLPGAMLRIMIVHNITPGTYAAARSLRDSVHATVGVSERCRRDLVHSHGFPPEHTVAIPNAVDTSVISVVGRKPRPEGRTRLIFLGRIEDASKGVFWLPTIMDRLPQAVSLTVAGDGPDLPRLTRRLERHAGRVRILGAVAPEFIPKLLASHDVMVVPSRFEGFGFTIIEAMAAGCVPVASHISGVTDTIIEEDISGLLFPVGDWGEAADRIARLHESPAFLDELSAGARRRAQSGFGLEAMAEAYFALIEKLVRERPPLPPPPPIEAWKMPSGLRTSLRTYLPLPIKNFLRVVMERL